jgi:hypothetical protein
MKPYQEKPMLKPIDRQGKTAGVDFRNELPRWGEECANEFINRNISLNESVVKIAEQNSLNEYQVRRLIQEANTITYNKLYDNTKGSDVRRPKFEIARYDQIRERLKFPEPNTIVEKCASDQSNNHMEKVAALKMETGLTGQWSYKMGSLATEGFNEEANKRTLLMKKIAQKGAELMQKEASSTEEFFKRVKIIGEALIKCAQLEGNENEVFNELCKDASLSFGHQAPLVAYVDGVLELRKEGGVVPNNFSVDFTINKKAEGLSLGEYSLSKTAARKPNIPSMTAEDVLIQNYQDLINQANALVKAQAQMVEDNKAVDAFKEKIRSKGMDILEEDENEQSSNKPQ